MTDKELWKFVEFLSLLSKFPEIAADPKLILIAAKKLDFRDAKVLYQMTQVQ